MTAAELIAKYGPPDAHYLSEYCIMWNVREEFPWFMVNNIYINKDFKDMLAISFAAVQAADLQTEIVTYNGCYANRTVRGSNSISAHAYAGAIDMDAALNPMFIAAGLPMDDPKRLGHWSQEFVTAMTSSGVFFGGYFKHRSDAMHFSMADM